MNKRVRPPTLQEWSPPLSEGDSIASMNGAPDPEPGDPGAQADDDGSASGNRGHRAKGGPPEPTPIFDATPWWEDPATIPPRQWLYGTHLSRGTVSATIAAGGRAKTTVSLVESVAMATGRDLIGGGTLPSGPLRVWHLNAEETKPELDRRLAAVCMHYEVSKENLGGRLIAESIKRNPIKLATLIKNIPIVNQPVVDGIIRFIEANRIDVLSIDPLISFHRVRESVNEDMDCVLKEALGIIADRTNCAIDTLHHTGKFKLGQTESTVDDGRGASSILWAVRSARVMNLMTVDEAKRLGIGERARRLHIRISDGKANMGPLGAADWIKLIPKNLPNGDVVVCASSWTPPDPFAGVTVTDMELARELARTGAYKNDVRSADWFGFALATQLKIQVAFGAENDEKDVARIKDIIKTWIKNKVLMIESRHDEKQRKNKNYVVPGPFKAEEPTEDDEAAVDD
jgi:hypothetical protein